MFEIIELNYTEQVGNLTIKVIDAATKENLSNAEIAIYDSLGNIVYRISTTNSEINVTLPIGDYNSTDRGLHSKTNSNTRKLSTSRSPKTSKCNRK